MHANIRAIRRGLLLPTQHAATPQMMSHQGLSQQMFAQQLQAQQAQQAQQQRMAAALAAAAAAGGTDMLDPAAKRAKLDGTAAGLVAGFPPASPMMRTRPF